MDVGTNIAHTVGIKPKTAYTFYLYSYSNTFNNQSNVQKVLSDPAWIKLILPEPPALQVTNSPAN
jgi:hypothetical protein